MCGCAVSPPVGLLPPAAAHRQRCAGAVAARPPARDAEGWCRRAAPRARVRACVCAVQQRRGECAPGRRGGGLRPRAGAAHPGRSGGGGAGGGGAARCAAGGRACHPKRPQTGDFDRGYIPSATRACLCWLCHHELLSGGAGGIAVPGRGGATPVEVLEYSGRHALSLPEADLLRACECAPPPLPASPAGP
jgi:hypothetical protein